MTIVVENTFNFTVCWRLYKRLNYVCAILPSYLDSCKAFKIEKHVSLIPRTDIIAKPWQIMATA